MRREEEGEHWIVFIALYDFSSTEVANKSKSTMKKELNGRITYCQTVAISQSAAKAHQGKTQRDREATKKYRGKRE